MNDDDNDPTDRNAHIRKLLEALDTEARKLGLELAIDPVVMFDRSGNGADVLQAVFAIDWSAMNAQVEVDEAATEKSRVDEQFEALLGSDDEIMTSLARAAQEDDLIAARDAALERRRRLTGGSDTDDGGEPPVPA